MEKIKLMMGSLLVLLCMPLSVFAGVNGGFQKGVAAYQVKDYTMALKYWKPLAEQGHARPQFNLGIMYENGRGVTQSDSDAANWYRKAADQGYVKAYFPLGDVYDKLGKARDALNWYAKAAEAGDAGAMGTIGAKYYLDGSLGFKRDVPQARIWFSLAASRGSFAAEIFRDNYGPADIPKNALKSKVFLNIQLKKLLHPGLVEFEKGEGLVLQKSYIAAYKQFEASDKAGYKAAKNRMKEIKPQIESEVFEKAKSVAMTGNVQAQFRVAAAYFSGQGVRKDVKQGQIWLQKAADGGYPIAQFELAKFYFQKRDADQAAKWFYKVGRAGLRARNKNAVSGAIQGLNAVAQKLRSRKASAMATELQKLSKRL